MSQRIIAPLLREITPLTDEDCLYVSARKKTGFDFPVHVHADYELNYIEGAGGAERIVGDSIETIDDYELVLIGNELAHGWNNAKLKPGSDINEITIQFSANLISETLLSKKQFASVKRMFELAKTGVKFSLPTILKTKPLLNSLTCETTGFFVMTTFLNLLYELSIDPEIRAIAKQNLSRIEQATRSRRIKAVCAYIDENYSKQIKLKDLANVSNMSGAALSRFFKHHTGKSITDYIIELRISKAAKELIETDKTVAEICYLSGFNNISNFNRLFKRFKGCTPKEFRDAFRKRQLLV